jgi:hypothetical protein
MPKKKPLKGVGEKEQRNMSTLKSPPRRVVDMEIVLKKLPLALS